jgi:hypothetical protein
VRRLTTEENTMTTPTPDRAEQAVRDILTAAGYPQLADEGAGPEWRIVTPGWHVFTYHGKVRVDWWSDGTLSANPSCWAADSACLAALRPALEAAGLTVWAPDGSVLEITGPAYPAPEHISYDEDSRWCQDHGHDGLLLTHPGLAKGCHLCERLVATDPRFAAALTEHLPDGTRRRAD